MTLFKFADVYGAEIYINASQVTFLKPHESDSTEIYVAGNADKPAVRVKLTPDRVASVFGWARGEH